MKNKYLSVFCAALLSTSANAAFINFDQFPGMNFLGGIVPIKKERGQVSMALT